MNAPVITEQHLAEMVPPVLEGLRDAGYFIDDIKIGNIPRLFIITKESHCVLTSFRNYVNNNVSVFINVIRNNNNYYKSGCQNANCIILAQHKVQ